MTSRTLTCSPASGPARGLKLPSSFASWSQSAATAGGCSAAWAAASLAAIVAACSDSAAAGYACDRAATYIRSHCGLHTCAHKPNAMAHGADVVLTVSTPASPPNQG
jgi:hypothetical protein